MSVPQAAPPLYLRAFVPAARLSVMAPQRVHSRGRSKPPRKRRRQGAMLVLLALMLVGFMVVLTFSVDIARMHLIRTELRTATDAAAKAAAGSLADAGDAKSAIARGQAIAAQNQVRGQPLLLTAEDFELGHSQFDESGVHRFTPGGNPTNSVRVTARRTAGSTSAASSLLLGSWLGRPALEPRHTATAVYRGRDVVLMLDPSDSTTTE